ncbi:MAG: RHS repeat-associated core domain-containing protein [Johnsonella sp.]|nr:RHS repeat-associated core domain-containing protein [Johnsonella sp.]
MGKDRACRGSGGSVRYAYDRLGRISGIDTDLLRTEYTYDARGRITQVRAINAGSPVGDFHYTYDPNGNLLTIEKADQSTEHRSYDARNRLTKIAAGQKQLAEYRYDPSGDLLYAREGFWGEETELSYEYDTAHRLIQEQRRRGDQSSLRRFSYDARGNLIEEESENAGGEKVSLSYRYNLADQLLQKGEQSYRYDAGGNLIRAEGAGESRVYESDAGNRIVRVKTVAGETRYSYDVLNHLIGETRYEEGSAGMPQLCTYIPDYTADTDLALLKYGPEGKTAYVYGPEGSAGLYSDYHMYSLTKDRLYSTRTIRSEAGETVLAADYGAWGEPLFAYVKGEHVGGVLGEASYTGHAYGAISDLYYAKARMYSPEDKRFISSDPGRDGLNWYAYCRNNPLRYVDPDGRENIVVSGGIYSAEKRDSGEYYFEFIDSALKEVMSLRYGEEKEKKYDFEKTTLFVANAGYTKNDLDAIEESARIYHVNPVFFTDVNELIEYINNGPNGKRREDPVTDFRVFSHGYEGSIEFAHASGIGEEKSEKLSLTIDKIKGGKLHPDAFKDTFSVFYSCNAGTMKEGTSFAQEWVSITGGKTKAAIGRTDYKRINMERTKKERYIKYLYYFIRLGSVGGYGQPYQSLWKPELGTNGEGKIFKREQ